MLNEAASDLAKRILNNLESMCLLDTYEVIIENLLYNEVVIRCSPSRAESSELNVILTKNMLVIALQKLEKMFYHGEVTLMCFSHIGDFIYLPMWSNRAFQSLLDLAVLGFIVN